MNRSTSSTCACCRPPFGTGPSYSRKHISRQGGVSFTQVTLADAQLASNLEPGGYLELLDPVYPMESDDGTLLKDSAVYRWSDLLNQAATKLGSSLDSALSYKQQLIDAGFQDVTETVFKWPMNPWPKERRHKELGE